MDISFGFGGFVSIVFGFFVLIFIFKGVVRVNQAEEMIIERLGKYHRTLFSGLNFILPLVDKRKSISWKEAVSRSDGRSFLRNLEITRIDLREIVYDFPRQNVITSDNVTIQINALLYFQITDSKKATYEIKNLPDAIEKMTQTTLRNVIGELSLDQTLVSRDTVNSKLRLILDEATDKWGVKVNRVELQDIIPPAEIRTAMEKQMKAERDKRAVILTAEGQKQSKVLEAEGEKLAKIERAEGEKQSKILDAEGISEARKKVAEAEARAIEMISEAIGGDIKDPINYLVAIKYVDAIKNLSNNKGDKVVFMPFESSSLISTIGGIKELFTKK